MGWPRARASRNRYIAEMSTAPRSQRLIINWLVPALAPSFFCVQPRLILASLMRLPIVNLSTFVDMSLLSMYYEKAKAGRLIFYPERPTRQAPQIQYTEKSPRWARAGRQGYTPLKRQYSKRATR